MKGRRKWGGGGTKTRESVKGSYFSSGGLGVTGELRGDGRLREQGGKWAGGSDLPPPTPGPEYLSDLPTSQDSGGVTTA